MGGTGQPDPTRIEARPPRSVSLVMLSSGRYSILAARPKKRVNFRLVAVAILCAGAGAGAARQAAGQSASQLGAWDGAMVTPFGALAPSAAAPSGMTPGANAWSLRYGRWRVDAADAVHDNGGLTWTHAFAFAQTQLSLTGGYGLIECPTCSGWLMGGIDVQSALWKRTVSDSSGGGPIAAAIGARVSVGGGRYRGREPVNAQSAGVTLPIEISLQVHRVSALRASIAPGLVFGRIASAESAESGVLPVVGGAVAWAIGPAFDVSVGMQRVILAGGTTQLGAALTWTPAARAAVRP